MRADVLQTKIRFVKNRRFWCMVTRIGDKSCCLDAYFITKKKTNKRVFNRYFILPFSFLSFFLFPLSYFLFWSLFSFSFPNFTMVVAPLVFSFPGRVCLSCVFQFLWVFSPIFTPATLNQSINPSINPS